VVYVYLLSVMEPVVIRRQMLMQQFTMLKFFLSALASSNHHLKLAVQLFITADCHTTDMQQC